jgi:hypothetical protein
MEETLQSFLKCEVSDQDFYDGIIDFIHNGNIRCGEYECNQFVIKKMDPLNFIVFEEYVIEEVREIHHSISISKAQFSRTINEYAEKQGFIIRCV